MTIWREPESTEVPGSLSELSLHPLVAETLVRLGITDLASARAFLDPDLAASSPFPDLGPALELLSMAIRKRETVCVWGDFDVDGQTATALLVHALQAVGADVRYYIPIRGKEGHGVHIESLQTILDQGTRLIITCDTGVTAHAAIEFAHGRGVQVIVTDHHDPGESLPHAAAIINPKLLPKGHPLADLAGVGVAYKLAEALLQTNGSASAARSNLAAADLLDLVALGLIADVALLRAETRTLAQRGIRQLRQTARIGLRAIAELSETNLEIATEETIGFSLAPRLNAMGRLSDANPAVELLLTQNPARARVLAAQVEGLNAQRRLLTSQVYLAAEAQLRAQPGLLTEPAIVLSHANWPAGVVGIVANKLVERYHKPAVLLSESDDGMLRGSARSVEGLHVTEAIAAQKHMLVNFGGHPMAAGLALPADKLADFRRGLGKAIERQLGEAARMEPTLQIDAWIPLGGISLELAAALEQLAPFGAGNPPLMLAARDLTLVSARPIGRAREHVRLVVADPTGAKQAVLWWNGGSEELPAGRFDLAFSLRASTFRGERQIELRFEEFRIVEAEPAALAPTRPEVVDLRSKPGALQGLEALVFAEGEHQQSVQGLDRYHLAPSDELAVYTAPPGPAELRAIVEQVAPKKVYLLAVPPAAERPDAYLTRLAGMAKFALNQRGGQIRVSELAAATAQREATVRLGLEWLRAGGHLQIEGQDDELHVSGGSGASDPYAQKELYLAIQGLLEETAAYRAHLARADAQSLF